MEAIILAGGRGSRLGYAQNKSSIRVNGNSLLNHNINQLASFVETFWVVEGFYSVPRSFEYDVRVLSNKKGVISALKHAVSHIKESAFVAFGDEYVINPCFDYLEKTFIETSSTVTVGYVQRHSARYLIHDTYSLDCENKKVTEIIEKPTQIVNGLQGTAYSIINKDFEQYLDDKTKSYPECIQNSIENGRLVTAVELAEEFFNINTDSDLTRLYTHFD